MADRPHLDRILRLYPQDWQDRYGEELRDLVDELTQTGEFSTTRITAGLVLSALIQRSRSWRSSWRLVVATGAVIALVVSLVIVVTESGSGPSRRHTTLTKGTIPQPHNGGPFNTRNIPDFITALGHAGQVVGYVPKAYLYRVPNQPVRVGGVIPVYASDFKTLVGHMYPGVGFVPLGKSIDSIPCTSVGAGILGSTTTLPCPSGPETVPNVAGAFTPAGMVAIQHAGLGAAGLNEHSRSVPRGHVIRTSPPAGSRVPARTQIFVYNSLGR